MNKGEIIQENLRLKEMVETYLTHMIRMTETIDELTKENAELKDWKEKWEERYNAGI